MKVPVSTLAPILRSDTQGRVLARLFTDPSRGFNLTELVAWAGSSMPTVQREIGRAESAGIVTTEKVGPTRVVRVNPAHPLYQPLSQIVLATYGPPAVVARVFKGLEGVEAVVLFGSWASRYLGEQGRAPNDIDVLVIGAPPRARLDDAADMAERQIGMPVQATICSAARWIGATDSFVEEVKRRPLLVVLGDQGAIEALGLADAPRVPA